jgi:hypothetical protein
MKFDDHLIGPGREGNLYSFLRLTAQEWQFLTYADALGLSEADKTTLAGAALARDSAVDQWNRWMYRQRGRDWFLVHQRHILEEDHRNERRGLFLTAGSSVLVVHRCESVFATVARRERRGLASDGGTVILGEEEQVDLHCVLSPPHDDTLKVLPVSTVPNVSVFNH